MPDTRPIAVFGAGGKAGTELLKHAFGRDVPIRAFEHNLPEPSERIGEFEYIDCDVLSDAATRFAVFTLVQQLVIICCWRSEIKF